MTLLNRVRCLSVSLIVLTPLHCGAQAAALAPSTATVALVLQPGSTLWLVGDSTLHPFTCHTTELTIDPALDRAKVASGSHSAAIVAAMLQLNALAKLDVMIPVKSLKSKEASLDKNMYKALNADSYPTIFFHLSSYRVHASTINSHGSRVTALGTLTIAGRERPIELIAETALADKSLRVQGEYALLMTEYGIKPPTLMMGTIKVRDPVAIHFDVRLGASAATP